MTVPSLIRFSQPQPLADANGLATEPMIYDPFDPIAPAPDALPDGVVAIRPAGYPVPDFAAPSGAPLSRSCSRSACSMTTST